MPRFVRGETSIYYEEFGGGYPLLLFAPGGMRSTIDFWRRMPFDPTREFAGDFRVIAMDQRNAGQSNAPITPDDGWPSYTADHLALLDHLGIDRCHVMGGCIGSSYCLGIVQAAPQRITAAVLQNPIGLSAGGANRPAFYSMFDEWITELAAARQDAATAASSFREHMFGGEFVFSVSRDFVRGCRTPLLVLPGNDNFHPTPTAREIVDLAPNAEFVGGWGEPEIVPQTVERIRAFLQANTPVAV